MWAADGRRKKWPRTRSLSLITLAGRRAALSTFAGSVWWHDHAGARAARYRPLCEHDSSFDVTWRSGGAEAHAGNIPRGIKLASLFAAKTPREQLDYGLQVLYPKAFLEKKVYDERKKRETTNYRVYRRKLIERGEEAIKEGLPPLRMTTVAKQALAVATHRVSDERLHALSKHFGGQYLSYRATKTSLWIMQTASTSQSTSTRTFCASRALAMVLTSSTATTSTKRYTKTLSVVCARRWSREYNWSAACKVCFHAVALFINKVNIIIYLYKDGIYSVIRKNHFLVVSWYQLTSAVAFFKASTTLLGFILTRTSQISS